MKLKEVKRENISNKDDIMMKKIIDLALDILAVLRDLSSIISYLFVILPLMSP
jgi:hypothetical protein